MGRLLLIFTGLLVPLWCGAAAPPPEDYGVLWKLKTTGAWPPA